MSSEEAFFKIRPTKRSNPESRTTLDSLHTLRVQNMLEREKDVENIKKDIEDLQQMCRETRDEVSYEQNQKQIRELEKEIQRRTGGNEFFDYFLDTGEILYNYYEI